MRDKHGREYHEGDLVRTPHFRGPRGKLFYLYHVVTIDGDGHVWLTPTSHLAGDSYVRGGGKCLLKYASPGAEIIDGHTNGWWYDRPRIRGNVAAQPQEGQ